jgi:hypothetical protein
VIAPKKFHPICHLTSRAFTHHTRSTTKHKTSIRQHRLWNSFNPSFDRIDNGPGIFGDAIDHHMSLIHIPNPRKCRPGSRPFNIHNSLTVKVRDNLAVVPCFLMLCPCRIDVFRTTSSTLLCPCFNSEFVWLILLGECVEWNTATCKHSRTITAPTTNWQYAAAQQCSPTIRISSRIVLHSTWKVSSLLWGLFYIINSPDMKQMWQSTEYWAQTSNIFASKSTLETAANKELLFPITNLLQRTQTIIWQSTKNNLYIYITINGTNEATVIWCNRDTFEVRSSATTPTRK